MSVEAHKATSENVRNKFVACAGRNRSPNTGIERYSLLSDNRDVNTKDERPESMDSVSGKPKPRAIINASISSLPTVS